jgi:hypothetical protein
MAVKTQLDKTQVLEIIYGFFKEFENWIGQSKVPTVADLEKYLAKKYHISSNGQHVAHSTDEYLNRYQRFQKKYSKFQISKPIEEPLISGNRVAFHYKVDLTTHQNQRKQVFIGTIATIEDNKILDWNQIAHESGAGDWDK